MPHRPGAHAPALLLLEERASRMLWFCRPAMSRITVALRPLNSEGSGGGLARPEGFLGTSRHLGEDLRLPHSQVSEDLTIHLDLRGPEAVN